MLTNASLVTALVLTRVVQFTEPRMSAPDIRVRISRSALPPDGFNTATAHATEGLRHLHRQAP